MIRFIRPRLFYPKSPETAHQRRYYKWNSNRFQPKNRRHVLILVVINVIVYITRGANVGVIRIVDKKEGNLYLYEKMGYRQTGRIEHINERMDIVFYEKE